MAYVSVHFLEKRNNEYIYEFRPLFLEENKGVISINSITGEHNIIQKSQEYSGFMGHAFSILREFRKNGDFKETGTRIWG